MASSSQVQSTTASRLSAVRVRKAPPKFYSTPHNKIAEPGETVRFRCNVGGHPSPKVTWDRDNIAIKADDSTSSRFRIIEENDDVRILEIRNVVSEVNRVTFSFCFPTCCNVFYSHFVLFKDAGLYRITVENELGRIQANARLDILGRAGSSGRSPATSGFVRSGSSGISGATSKKI